MPQQVAVAFANVRRVLEAAGGSVKTLDGRPFVYGKVDEAFRNPFFVARGRP